MTAIEALRPGTRHPPSDGAHRLAWWLAWQDEPADRLAEAGVSSVLCQRLLTGEVEPADELAATIAAVTGGAVRPEDWRRGGPLGWTDEPYERN